MAIRVEPRVLVVAPQLRVHDLHERLDLHALDLSEGEMLAECLELQLIRLRCEIAALSVPLRGLIGTPRRRPCGDRHQNSGGWLEPRPLRLRSGGRINGGGCRVSAIHLASGFIGFAGSTT